MHRVTLSKRLRIQKTSKSSLSRYKRSSASGSKKSRLCQRSWSVIVKLVRSRTQSCNSSSLRTTGSSKRLSKPDRHKVLARSSSEKSRNEMPRSRKSRKNKSSSAWIKMESSKNSRRRSGNRSRRLDNSTQSLKLSSSSWKRKNSSIASHPTSWMTWNARSSTISWSRLFRRPTVRVQSYLGSHLSSTKAVARPAATGSITTHHAANLPLSIETATLSKRSVHQRRASMLHLHRLKTLLVANSGRTTRKRCSSLHFAL